MGSYQVSEDFLLNHAYRNVWCTPEQDKQAIFQLPKVTPPNGSWSYFTYQWRKIRLPITSNSARFHVYQVGQVHPSILGLVNKPNTWINAADAMMQESVLIDIYNAKGIMVPKSLVWYIVIGDKNLLVAIRKPIESPVKLVDVNLEEDDVFMRLYSNAYFNSIRANMSTPPIQVKSIKATSVEDISSMQAAIAQLPNYGGVFSYVNGCRVNTINLLTAKIGDYIEYVFDASVKREVVFNVRQLQEFDSSLDDLNKFLLHYPGISDIIDYQDDVDMYLGTNAGNGSWRSVYVHKNDSRTMRMVTHRDYSIPTIRVRGTQAANSFLVEKDLYLRLTIRHSGYTRPLVFDNNRIAELYKLPTERVIEAMVGVDSTVSVWKAAALEASGYTKIMRQPQGGITKEMVQQGYGYNAMSVLLGNTPQKVTLFNDQKLVTIPEGLRGHCTVYEYNANGKLLRYTPHTLDDTYSCQDPAAAFVEIISGIGGIDLDILDNTTTGLLDPMYNYRFYTADGIGGIRTSDWSDRSGDPYYIITSNRYTWVNIQNTFNRIVSNKRHLAYTFEMNAIAGVFEFDLAMQKNGEYQKLDIPLGELDLFFNGYALIEGLDFVVHKSRVVITAKNYVDTSLEKQSITVRYTGFCNKDMSRTQAPDVGFVYHENLSVNNRYDIRDDRVLRIVCGGRVKLRENLTFAEDGIGVNIVGALNGAPYAIRDVVVPMNNYLVGALTVEDKTYTYRETAQAIDKEVSDHLTKWLPQEPTALPNAINGRYQVYSPFLSRIIDDLKTGVLADDKFQEHFGDDWLRTRLAAYDRLLDFDPISKGMDVDERYVVIHPHPYPDQVSLNMYQYRIVDRIAKLVAKNIDLSSTIHILQF